MARLAAPFLVLATALLAQSTRSVWDGVYTSEQARRGQQLYADNCAACHAVDLTGGESAPALAGSAFLANWSGHTVGDLFELVRTSMPKSNPGALTSRQYADVVAHILSTNRFPTGKTDLDTDADSLKLIRLSSQREK